MKSCIRNGNILAFSLGLLASCLLPQSLIVVVIALGLAIVSAVSSKCCRF